MGADHGETRRVERGPRGLPDARSDPLPAGISVVVPVYNSEGSLEPLVGRLAAALADRRRSDAGFEVILVDDGSRDGSWAVVQALAREHDFVRGFALARNYGQHNALLCGIRNARFATTVTLDDDLQHPPEEVGRLLDALETGNDVVYGPPLERAHNLFRSVASLLTRVTLRRAMGADSAGNVSAFRAFRTRIRDAFAQYSGSLVSIDVLLTWGTARFGYVRVRHERRTIGKSNYTLRKLLSHAMNMVTGFSTLPLQFATWVGFASVAFGLCILVYVLGRYLLEGTMVPGFTFLATTITIFSGVILFSLGLIGEYIARMHLRLMERPSYVVRDMSRSELESTP